MQTFLPYADYLQSAKVLDYKRLGKQRVEAMQIIKALTNSSYGWQNHPAVKMWAGNLDSLKLYHDTILTEWVNRGYNNSMQFMNPGHVLKHPEWLGNEKLHASHRANLLRKNYEFYKQFNWAEDPLMEYWWPVQKEK